MRTRGSQTQEKPASADHEPQIPNPFLGHFQGLESVPLIQLKEPAAGPTAEWVLSLLQQLLKASCSSVSATAQVLPAKLCRHIIKKVAAITNVEPALVELILSTSQQPVTVFGDLHGHFHDLCNMLQILGGPSTDRIYIFNGDFVDRGAWGFETLMLLLAYKWLLPNNVYLVRGNHEGTHCIQNYGFDNEVAAKYGRATQKAMHKDFLQLFKTLPLAVLVESNTLILHGGLFRVPPRTEPGQTRRYTRLGDLPEGMEEQLQTGSLDDLRNYKSDGNWYKGGVDPDPDVHMCELMASDILWSDPSQLPGHVANKVRLIGTRFGPDVTEAFLSANKLKLIIRSHEGPDARFKRAENDQMPSIDTGYCVDHETPSGKLVTLFSAPSYPMFTAPNDVPFTNLAAALHLSAPDYATPVVQHFEALMPRPAAAAHYKVESLSDCETEECSGMQSQATVSGSSVGQPDASQASPSTDTASSQQAASAAEAQQDPLPSQPSAVAAAVFGELSHGKGKSKRHKASSQHK